MKLSQLEKSGRLTRRNKIYKAGSEDEGYHKTHFDAHSPGSPARVGGSELFGIGATGPDGGEQWRLGELSATDGGGSGDSRAVVQAL